MIGSAFLDSLNISQDALSIKDAASGMDINIDFMAILNQAAEESNAEKVVDEADEDTENIVPLVAFNDSIVSFDTSEETTLELDAPVIENLEEPVEVPEETTESSEPTIDEDMLKELNIESIEVETDGSSEEQTLMQRQTPQEQAVKVMLNSDIETPTFEIKTPQTQTPTKPVEITPNKIVEQITKQMESLQNNSKLNIVLNPESLGKVAIRLVSTPEGLSAQFTVATQEARDLLMKGLDGLKESLISHGVGVDNVSVKLNDTQKASYNQDWTEQEGSRGGNKEQGRSNKDEKEKGLFEKMMAQNDEENGNV